MSLRARLMLDLLALAAVGLLIADAVSYAALRSYLLDRVDHQVESALPLVGKSFGPVLIQRQVGGKTRAPVPLPPPLTAQPGQPVPQLPPGVFGELRNARGKVIHERTSRSGRGRPPGPSFPPRFRSCPT